MNSEHAAFLEAIRANPDDDGPRLVYADWLEERGDPRGEFVRIQIELARHPGVHAEALRRREQQLLEAHAHKWVPRELIAISRRRSEIEVWIECPGRVWEAGYFRRGFWVAHRDRLKAKELGSAHDPPRSFRVTGAICPLDAILSEGLPRVHERRGEYMCVEATAKPTGYPGESDVLFTWSMPDAPSP